MVQYNEWHSAGRKAWADLSSDNVNLAVILGRHRGTCGPRFTPGKALPSERNDLGFFFWTPANITVFGYSEGAQLVREFQVRFDSEKLMLILGDEFQIARLGHPTASIYDDRAAKCASLLADCCIDDQPEDQVFGESLYHGVVGCGCGEHH